MAYCIMNGHQDPKAEKGKKPACHICGKVVNQDPKSRVQKLADSIHGVSLRMEGNASTFRCQSAFRFTGKCAEHHEPNIDLLFADALG